MVGKEERKPCISINRPAELSGFQLHYINSLLAEEPPLYILERIQFLYLPVSNVARNFPGIAAAVKMQQLLPFKGQP